MPNPFQHLQMKSLEEVISRLNELVKRHCRKYIKRNLRPCPYNCKVAQWDGRKVTCCGRLSTDPDKCFRPEKFVPVYTKDELYNQFKQDLKDPEILVREYRDIAMLMWVAGADNEFVSESEMVD